MQRNILLVPSIAIACSLGIGCEETGRVLPSTRSTPTQPDKNRHPPAANPVSRNSTAQPGNLPVAEFVDDVTESVTATHGTGLQSAELPAVARQPAASLSAAELVGEATSADTESNDQDADHAVLTLRSGTTVNLESLMERARIGFEQRMAKKPTRQQMLKWYYPTRTGEQSQQLHMTVGRKRGLLDGPMAAYYRDGSPMIYVTFAGRGRREGTLLAWDEEQRPVLLAQYESGKRHGIRCLFKPCEANCPKGHVSVVQEWTRGRLMATHIVGDEDRMQSYDMTRLSELTDATALLDAIRDLNAFDDQLSKNERQLRATVAGLHRQELQAAALAQAETDQQRRAMAQAWMATVSRMALASRMSAAGCIGGG